MNPLFSKQFLLNITDNDQLSLCDVTAENHEKKMAHSENYKHVSLEKSTTFQEAIKRGMQIQVSLLFYST